jgi:hypothetical protein
MRSWQPNSRWLAKKAKKRPGRFARPSPSGVFTRSGRSGAEQHLGIIRRGAAAFGKVTGCRSPDLPRQRASRFHQVGDRNAGWGHHGMGQRLRLVAIVRRDIKNTCSSASAPPRGLFGGPPPLHHHPRLTPLNHLRTPADIQSSPSDTSASLFQRRLTQLVPEARQNSSTRSGTVTSAAIISAVGVLAKVNAANRDIATGTLSAIRCYTATLNFA